MQELLGPASHHVQIARSCGLAGNECCVLLTAYATVCVWCTQAYSMMHTAADGKLPRITAVLHVEGFHALCQHPELVTKVGQTGWAWCLFYY